MLKITEDTQQKIHNKFISKIYDKLDKSKRYELEETIEVNKIVYVVNAELEIDLFKEWQPADPTEQTECKSPLINCYSYTISLLNSDMDDVIDCPLKLKLENDLKTYI